MKESMKGTMKETITNTRNGMPMTAAHRYPMDVMRLANATG
jgi:hypothetical protein